MPSASITSRAAAIAAAAALALVGCGGAQHRSAAPPAAPAGSATSVSNPSTVGTTRSATTAKSRPGTSTASRLAQAAAQRTSAGSRSSTRNTGDVPGQRGTSPYIWSVTAHVTPTCVVAGRTARVTVRTARNAALAYVAVYHGEKSGAAPPFGYGYGGNSDGYSSPQDGTWGDTWTVRADAPTGKARVTVVVAWHQTSKQVDVPFTVVSPLSGTC